MSASNLSFSATLPPFYYTNGYTSNYSSSNLSATGNLFLTSAQNSATGQTTTTVSSSVTSNGTNYTADGADINGNEITVFYQANGAPAGQNISGEGVSFSPQSSTASSGGTLTTSYNTNPNDTFGLAIPGAATSTGNSSNDQNILLKNFSVVGDAFAITFQVTDGNPDNTTVQAPSAAAPITNTVTFTAPDAVRPANGAGFTSQGVMSIGDVLAASNGFSSSNSLGGALQAASGGTPSGLATGTPAPDSVLASSLNPALNLSPNATLQVTDFINTSPNAFAPSPDTAASNTNTNTNAPNNAPDETAGNQPANQAAPADTFGSSQNSFSSSSNAGFNAAATSAGIYNAIANASASIIVGGNVNTVA